MRIVLLIITVIAAIILCIAAVMGYMQYDIDVDDTLCDETGLYVHYIDVGQADSTLVVCDGKAMLIDGGNAEDSDLLYSYLKKHDIDYLDYVVATHIHEDHIGGLSGALKFADAGKVYCSNNESDELHFKNFKRTVEDRGLEIEIPKAGEKFALGSSEVFVLACNAGEDENNSSIALKLTYGETSFLFMGDAEFEAEQYIIDSEYDIGCTVLKAGHHGSSTSSSYHFLSLAKPEYAVISCGKNNSYGHPHDEVIEKFNGADIIAYRTDIMGDIVCMSDGNNISFTSSKGNTERSYVLNTNTKKYHKTECTGVNSILDKNRTKYKGTERSLAEKGYSPCRKCG